MAPPKSVSFVGRVVSGGAIVLAYFTAPWALLLSAVIAVAATLWSGTFKVASDPHVQVGVQIFLALLWTYAGLRVLASLNTVSTVKMHPDFRYAISPESYGVGLDDDDPEAAFQLSVNFRNVLNWPIKIRVEHVRLLIEDRTCQEPDKPIEMVIPRIAVRGIRSGTFKKDFMKARNTGSLEMEIIYGDPDGEYERRFKCKSKLYLAFKRDAEGKLLNASVQDEFISSDDTAI